MVLRDHYETLAYPSKPGVLVGPKNGVDAAGEYSAAFHLLLTPQKQARFHAALYRSCPKKSPLDKIMRGIIEETHDARYENGTLGYIADPLALRKERLQFLRNSSLSRDEDGFFTALEHFGSHHRNGTWSEGNSLNADYICEEPGEGLSGGGFEIINKKIQIANVTKSPRILCAIYTHAHNRDMARTAALTWGYKCDGFLAFSTETIRAFGMVDLVHPGVESLENMWQKTRSIWVYIHEHYLDDYDYFHLGGDDHFVIVENLRRFLSLVDARTTRARVALLLGQWVLPPGGSEPQITGEAGYTLNRASVKRFVAEIVPACEARTVAKREDRILSECFRRIGVFPGDTRDEETGEQQYHRQTPEIMYKQQTGSARPDSVLLSYYASLPPPLTRHSNATVGIQTKLRTFGKYSTTFHFLRLPQRLARAHAILYRTCPADSPLGKQVIK
jgi:hypothetical protein